MIVRVTTSPAGVKYVYAVEGYRDERGKVKQRMVASYGKLVDLEAADPNALATLKAEARRASAERAARKGMISFDTAEPNDGAPALSLGWVVVDAVLGRLGVARVAKRLGVARGWDIRVDEVIRGLVAARVTWPGSKRAAVARCGELFGGPVLDLGQAYRALDHVADLASALLTAAREGVGADPSKLTTVDYDVTNYFFHVDAPDETPIGVTAGRGEASREGGHSKENRVEPIIQMGLFLDVDGVPLSYRLFDGNVPDMSTLTTALAEFKAMFRPGRVVVVADKAMNTGPNLAALAQAGDGWIVSASARNAVKEMRDWILDPAGWVVHPDGSKTKSRLVDRSLPVTLPDSVTGAATVPEKVLARWSPESAARDAKTRAQMLAKAETLALNPSAYQASKRRGVRKYVKEERVDRRTGEVSTCDPALSVDHARADREALMDGHQVIRTSETGLADADIVFRYHQLWRIEQTFRVSKTDLDTRPVFVWSHAHIEAHFALCFLALLVVRLLERWTRLTTNDLLDAIRGFHAVRVSPDVFKIIRPASWDTIDAVTGVSLNQNFATTTEIRTWAAGVRKAAHSAEYTTRPDTPNPRETP